VFSPVLSQLRAPRSRSLARFYSTMGTGTSPRAAPAPAPLWQEAAPRRAWLRRPESWWRLLPRSGLADVFGAYKLDWRGNAAGDVGAGVVVAIMLIPQALAYAALAGMPPATGFFAAIAALFTYPLLGSSGHQAVGPVALMSLLSMTAVTQAVDALGVAGASPASTAALFSELSYTLAFLVGAIQLGMGALRAGYLIHFLSHPVLAGFTAASAVIIASSQLNKALGFAIPRSDYVWQTWRDVALGLPRTHGLSVGLFVVNYAMFWALTRGRQAALRSAWVKARPALGGALKVVPIALIVVLVSTLAAGLGRLDTRGLRVLGTIPGGMPTLSLSGVFNARLSRNAAALLPSAVLMSVISYVESASVAKSMASKYGVAPGTSGMDGNRELLGLGLANVAASVMGGFPVTGGFSRSSVNAEAGARTVAAGLVSGVLLCLVASFATGWFYYLPDVTLAAMIIFSALRLLESHTARYLVAVDAADAAVYFVTLGFILGAGIENGLMAGAALSLLRIVQEAARPHCAVLGRMPDGATYRNVARFPGLAAPVPGVAILRMDGPLFFANVGLFAERVVAAAYPPPVSSARGSSTGGSTVVAAAAAAATRLPPVRAVVLDFSGVSSVDSSGVHALTDTLPAELAKAAKRAAAVAAGAAVGGGGAADGGGKPPRLFVVAAHGPVRDRLAAADAAHDSLKGSLTSAAARAVAGACRGGSARRRHVPVVTGGGGRAGHADGDDHATTDDDEEDEVDDVEAGGGPRAPHRAPVPSASDGEPLPSDGDVTLATLFSASAAAAGAARGATPSAVAAMDAAQASDSAGAGSADARLAAGGHGDDGVPPPAAAGASATALPPAGPGGGGGHSTVTAAVLAHPASAGVLLRQVDLHAAVVAVTALLAAEAGAASAAAAAGAPGAAGEA
jgi:sulfate permease, SulP family